jgi:hypothetical protein
MQVECEPAITQDSHFLPPSALLLTLGSFPFITIYFAMSASTSTTTTTSMRFFLIALLLNVTFAHRIGPRGNYKQQKDDDTRPFRMQQHRRKLIDHSIPSYYESRQSYKQMMSKSLDCGPGHTPGGAANYGDCMDPTASPTPPPTQPPIDPQVEITYQPGEFSNMARSVDNNLILSNGLVARPIAETGEFVEFDNGGGQSATRFHVHPDGAAVFEKPDGGWYYTSNAENETVGSEWWNGGVGSIEFNSDGSIIGYQRVADRLRMNCGGGKTPWNSWATCEEADNGRVYQVDPAGVIFKNQTALGRSGHYESFAYDDKTDVPTFYVTRDSNRGALTRFTPNDQGMACFNMPKDADRWCTLSHGSLSYLVISGGPSGTFTWSNTENDGRNNAESWYPNSEGIDVVDGMLYTTSKKLKQLMILNLRTFTYTIESTVGGAFDQQPDQVARLVDDADSILYFCEDGGKNQISPGVHGRNVDGRYFTILEGTFPIPDETTGLAYSPSGHHMYVSYQKTGIIYEIKREDGLPFHGSMLDIKYHAMDE